MSESENLPTPPPPSSPKTSAVPLKKETVRITLRSRPGEGSVQPREATAPVNPVTSSPAPVVPPAPRKATAPVQLPSAPLPPPAPKAASSPVKLPPPAAPAPMAPTAPRPAAPPAPSAPSVPPAPPAATVPMAAPAAPRPPAVPRPPVAAPAPGAPPKIETGATTAPIAKTVAMKPAPAAARPGASSTAPMVASPGGAAPASGGLPKATVKLQQTQPMARPSISAPPSAPVKRTASADAEQFYNEDKDPEEGLVPLSVVCLVFSAILLVIQMFGSDRVSSSDASPIMVPSATPVKWERLNEDHTWSNEFARHLPAIPE